MGDMDLLANTPSAFDRDFIDWWIGGPPVDWMGEQTPHDDLASFKAMLDLKGWTITRTETS